VKKRGTWFHLGNKAWYEIDKFITREEDRHRIVRALKIKNNEMLSDLKIVANERKQKKRGNINWEKMMNQEIADQYRKRTEEKANQEATRGGVNTEDLE